jgi:RHS repeat-associated protein
LRSDLNATGDAKLVSIQHFDQLGRVRLTRQLEDSANQSATDEATGIKVQARYRYSGGNYYELMSNPYRAASSADAGGELTMGWSTVKHDQAGRVVEAQTFSGAGLPAPSGGNGAATGTVNSGYNATEVTVTDQAGKSRKNVTDALGRLVQVYEDPSGLNYLTSYNYDGLNNLVNVYQGIQTRTFVYDSLKRLTSATNPESSTLNYQYDNNGNLTQKTDARGVATSYAYDALNRATSRSYSDGTPAVTYAYDSTSIANGRGRLASTSSSVSGYSYSGYDNLGRALGGTQTIGSQSYTVGYTYDRAGRVLTQTYPSGRTVTNTYDSAGRANSVSGNLGDGAGRTYSSGILYASSGQMIQEQFGTATPIYNKLFYNSRGQLVEIRESTTPNDSSWNRGAIINSYGGSDNNGNLRQQDTYIPHDDQVSSYTSSFLLYNYDGLNRLTTVVEPAFVQPPDCPGGTCPAWGQTYQYDRYGNRTIDPAWTWGFPEPQFTVDANTNQLGVPNGQPGAMTYDAAGNLTFDSYTGEGGHVYDAENRMTQAWANNQWQVYNYDGDGRRVKRNVNGTETWQVYGVRGELLAEYAANTEASNPLKEYGYRNGQLLVTAEPSANMHWLVADQLGTPRMIFDNTGGLSGTSRHDYLPFGEELYAGTNWRTLELGYTGDGTRQKFTQKERDNETGLDYFLARYYSSTQGRFTSADPEDAGAEEGEPQSWNGYAYVGNSPLTSTDSFGLWKEIDCSSGKGKCWESDNKNDTITSLAKLLNASAKDLTKFFQNPTIHIGDRFDASGFGRGSIPTSRDQGPAVVQVFLVSEPESTGDKIGRFFSNDESRFRAARMDKFWHDLFNPCNGPGQPRCRIGIMYPGGIASGLRAATPELAELFASGTIRNMPIISIRNTLREGGFTQTVTRNGSGYLFRNAAGEEVRIMSRGGGWDVRIRNSSGNYLDEFGNVGSPASTHGITVRSQ